MLPQEESGAVSLIIPAYNSARYVGQAIESALGQTRPAKEIIVVDDGSSDDTATVCAPYEGRIRLIHQENRGEAGVRNRALDVATGDYVALLDADDLCSRDRLEKQASALQRRPDAVACFSGHWVFGETRVDCEFAGMPAHADLGPVDFYCRLLVHPITMMFRRAAAVGLQFPVGVRTGGDMIFSALLRRRGAFVILPDVLYGYRRHQNQVTAGEAALTSLWTRLNWLKQNREAVWPEAQFDEVEREMWLGCAQALSVHYWARRKEPFLELLSNLRQHWPAYLEQPPELRLKWHPDWLWRLRGWLGRSVTRTPAQSFTASAEQMPVAPGI